MSRAQIENMQHQAVQLKQMALAVDGPWVAALVRSSPPEPGLNIDGQPGVPPMPELRPRLGESYDENSALGEAPGKSSAIGELKREEAAVKSNPGNKGAPPMPQQPHDSEDRMDSASANGPSGSTYLTSAPTLDLEGSTLDHLRSEEVCDAPLCRV